VFFVRDEQRPTKKVDHPHTATQDDRYFSISEIWIVIDGKSVVTKQMETRKVYCELQKNVERHISDIRIVVVVLEDSKKFRT
jgi:hypothetical protein